MMLLTLHMSTYRVCTLELEQNGVRYTVTVDGLGSMFRPYFGSDAAIGAEREKRNQTLEKTAALRRRVRNIEIKRHVELFVFRSKPERENNLERVNIWS